MFVYTISLLVVLAAAFAFQYRKYRHTHRLDGPR